MRRPSTRTVSGRIWEIADQLSVGQTAPAPRAEVVAKCALEGINKSTSNTQYGHWKRANFPGEGAAIGIFNSSRPEPSPRDGADWAKLLRHGFLYVGDFHLDEYGKPVLDELAPSRPGVYAIVRDQTVVYVGISNRTLRTRMNDYRRGHKGQRTSSRINSKLCEDLASGVRLRLLCATPEPTEWNGLPVNTAAGLELGLIAALKPAWNMQGLG